MRKIIAVPLALAALLGASARSEPQAEEASWTWVLAKSLESPEQEELTDLAQRMFDLYQGLPAYVGQLVPETELTAEPSGPTVFLGPADGFVVLPDAKTLREELQGIAAADQAVELTAVYAGDSNPRALSRAFQERVDDLIKGQRALFIGESHWNVGINRLFQATLQWLMANQRVSTLFMEESYSHSAHLQHYVTLASDEEAERFWIDSLRPLVISPLTRDLLDSVRSHNRAHPESAVAVACIDAEFAMMRTLRDVLAMYFRAQDPKFETGPPTQDSAGVLKEVQRLRGLLENEAPDARRHPWMSKLFVERALRNHELSPSG